MGWGRLVFGKYQCNILIISAYFKGTSIPIYWELLDNKSGNSSSEARISLLKKCVQLIGKNRILRIIGDIDGAVLTVCRKRLD
jgi:hypothetical protein